MGNTQDDNNTSANDAGTNDTSDNAQTSQQTTQDAANTATGDDNARMYTAEEVERFIARMKAADRRASDLEKKVQQFEDANKSELEKAQTEKERAIQEAAKAASELKNLRLQNAFLSQAEVAWEDPNDAFLILQTQFMEGVEVTEEGQVLGIKDAVKKMAKAKPHLVKKAPGSTEATGSAQNGQRKGSNGTPNRDALVNRFPMMKSWR